MRRPLSKYRAQPTTVDGIRFASKAEARRYGELKILEKAGEIGGLELQPRFPLHADNIHLGTYVADFRYFDADAEHWIIEDVKGMMTPLAKWKIKHVEAQYGIKVEIVR